MLITDPCRSDYAAVSATHAVAIYNGIRSYGIVFLFKRLPNTASSTEQWQDTGLWYESGLPSDKYGAGVAMDSNLLVVGAPEDTQQGTSTGAGGYCRYWGQQHYM